MVTGADRAGAVTQGRCPDAARSPFTRPVASPRCASSTSSRPTRTRTRCSTRSRHGRRTQGLDLYPAQTEALIELVSGNNVILATPTGSGKSLVAAGAHFAALAHGRRSVYTAPIKALVSEKFFALCDMFGADKVGMLTGDAAVNPDAPILTATAEVLANMALREGADLDVGHRRHGRVPLLRRPRPRLGMAGAAARAAARAVPAHVGHPR